MKLYHAGDTAVFGDMRLIGELYNPDIAPGITVHVMRPGDDLAS